MRWIVISALCLTLGTAPAAEPPRSVALDASLENVHQLAPGLYSGSQPDSEISFAALEQLGIKTLLSVDGALPDLEAAQRHGMRYIHLPIGYNGISTNRMLELAKVAAAADRPLYVHCHHGKHRGPAAAATLCLASGLWTTNDAITWLQQAGTSTNYLGLYDSVRRYQPPTPEALAQLPHELPTVSPPATMVSAMVAMDEHLAHLKRCAAADWQTPSEHPDILPAHEALQLLEHIRELKRQLETDPPSPAFMERLETNEIQSAHLHQVLQAGRTAQRDDALKSLSASCNACHAVHRN